MSDTSEWIDKIRGMFTRVGFTVSEIETEVNQYWRRGLGLPWLLVHTDAGVVEVGWRKRVIELDWTSALGIAATEADFEIESVTKGCTTDGELFIHAWSYEDLERYLVVLRAHRRPIAEVRELRVRMLAAVRRWYRGIVEHFCEESSKALKKERLLQLGCEHSMTIAGERSEVRLCEICGSMQ